MRHHFGTAKSSNAATFTIFAVQYFAHLNEHVWMGLEEKYGFAGCEAAQEVAADCGCWRNRDRKVTSAYPNPFQGGDY